jgi:hypothetical protein
MLEPGFSSLGVSQKERAGTFFLPLVTLHIGCEGLCQQMT